MHDALKVLFLLLVANGAPVLAYDIFKSRFSMPLDRGKTSRDGHPWFGPSKTYRGLVCSLAATVIAALLVGYTWEIGARIAIASMAGDLLSSFFKRRRGMGAGSQCLGVDQVPEALLPLLTVRTALDLSAGVILGLVAAFFVLELVLSRFLFKIHLRKHPY